MSGPRDDHLDTPQVDTTQLDMTGDHQPQPGSRRGVDRRTVIAGALTIGIAGSAGAVLARRALNDTAAGSVAAPAPAGAAPIVVARVQDVPRGGGVVLADQKLVLTRTADDVIRCFSATCTHQGCLVTSVSDRAIDCPCHGSQFDVATGEVLAGPARSPLAAVPVAIQGDAVVTA